MFYIFSCYLVNVSLAFWMKLEPTNHIWRHCPDLPIICLMRSMRAEVVQHFSLPLHLTSSRLFTIFLVTSPFSWNLNFYTPSSNLKNFKLGIPLVYGTCKWSESRLSGLYCIPKLLKYIFDIIMYILSIYLYRFTNIRDVLMTPRGKHCLNWRERCYTLVNKGILTSLVHTVVRFA